METETEKDGTMRRYLLGEMSDQERQITEEKFMEDDDFFEEIAAFEDELLYEYKQNLLTPKERLRFEEKFLKSPADREKAAFADAFLQATEAAQKEESTSFWQRVAAFFNFSNSALRVGMSAAAILIVLTLGFLLIKNSNWRNVAELPQNINTTMLTPTPTIDKKFIEEKQKEQEELQKQLDEEKQKSEQNANNIREIEEKNERLKREIEENQRKNAERLQRNQTPQKTFVALILSPGLINRGNGETASRIKLTPEIKILRLTLKSEVPPQRYKVVVRAIDGDREVWTNSVQKTSKNSFALSIPTKNLQRGDYEILVINPSDNEEIDSYYFSVLR